VFVGRHERQLDPKGRVALPAPFRPRFEPVCFVAFGKDGCIDIFTREDFENQAKEAMDKVSAGLISRDEVRALSHFAFDVTVDAQGRITIDRDLREYAGLNPDAKVVVAGSFDRVEIWNAEAYASVRARGTAAMKGA
jgi:MraZ protein